MINFFRKTRKKMADDNRPLKYMRYAIGEIVLVVVGILIALSINNWNEGRKNDKRLMNIFIEIQDDLSKDIFRLDEILTWYKKKDSLIYLVLQDSLTVEDYEDNPNIASLTYNYEELDIHANGFNNLMGNMDFIQPSHKPLVDKLKNLYVENKNTIDKYNEEIANQVLKNIRDLGETKKWAYKLGPGLTAEMKEYYVNDPFYKNSVKYYNVLLYNFSYLKYRSKASQIYSDLSELLGGKKELPIHLVNSIHNADSLKKYIGTYKPLDSVYSFNFEIKADKLDIYLKVLESKIEVFQVARDTFGWDNQPNLFLVFERGYNGKIVGFNIVDIAGLADSDEFKKID